MEKELRDLLINIIEQEEKRKQTIENARIDIEISKKREDMSLKRFEDKFKDDIQAGVFDFSDGQRDREIENGKAKISQEYQVERTKLEAKLLELEQTEENTDLNNRKIILALRKYRDEMMQKQYNTQKEMKKSEDKLNILEEQKIQELSEIDKQIREKETQYTHLIMRNRNTIDIYNKDTRDISLLSKLLEELKLQKGNIITKYQEQLDTIENEKQTLKSQVIEFDAKIENVNQFFGKIEVKDKTPKELYEILFGEEQLEKVIKESMVEDVAEEQQPEEVIEEPVMEDVAEEQQPEEVIEEPVVEDIAEEQQSEEVIEKPEIEEVAKEKKPVKKVEEVHPVVEVKKPIAEKKQSIKKQRKAQDEDINFKYYEDNKTNIIKIFMLATGIKKNETIEIFENKEHCKAIGERCRMAMKSPKKERNEFFKLMEDYYWEIDSKLDIEVSNKGIQYNQEIKTPSDITAFEIEKQEFVDDVIEKFEKQLLSYTSNPNKFVFDKNVIIAIAMDNSKENKEKKLELTTSGLKKMGEYLNLVVNPINKNGSVTYNLEKMSSFKGILNKSAWSPKKISEFRKIAYKAKDSYAQIIPDTITKLQWAVKDWVKGFTTRKLTKGVETAQKNESEKENKQKRNKWELPFEQKAFANSGRGKFEKTSKQKIEKEER